MKNLTNILSYLWLLLLMAVTACSDLEEEVGPMHVEEEVELNIQLHVPDMQASTREEMVITENISSIVAIAFDESGDLIKKVDAILSGQDHVSHSGTLKIKVPKRTQTIHFLGNYTKDDIEKSITSLETLNNFTTTDDTTMPTMPTMRYWGMTTFDGSNINQPVTLYRNMAKLTLKTGDGFTPNSCYIAGFVNRNISGTIVPGGHAVGDTPTIPNGVTTHTYTADNSLGNVYYLFEHANDKNNNPLYVIIEVAAKYYKVAFAAGDEYFPIIRNHEYTITIDGIDAMYAEDSYDAAVESQYPINDLVIDGVSMTVTASPTEVLNQSGQTFTVTVTIPKGITELNVPTHDAFDITPPNSLTEENGKYTVTPGSDYAFTFTVKDGVEAGDKTISFSGRGKYKSATGSATIRLYENATLPVYELWFEENNGWNGSNGYATFFTKDGDITTGNDNAGNMESTFYDGTFTFNDVTYSGADNHRSYAMTMGDGKSIGFTITEPRYLTLLVASNNGNTPSIQLSNDGTWATANSEDAVVPDNYNFCNGEIGTNGRLICYTLPAGTYTLQGSDDAAYLLYYLRVSTERPTMTDIVQPTASDYSLSWSGGEYGNYLKNGTKYYVDDDATIFTPKLTYEGLSKMPLTTTSVTVVTDTLYFQDNKDTSGTTILKATETKSYNGSNPTLEFNAGTYNNLCGTIENIAETDYKYAAFYDNIQLKEVSDIEVKNTIKVGLYDDWYSTEALDHYTEGQLMMTGFKMPTHTIPVPVDVEAGTVESIGFSVSDSEWVRKNSGLGIESINASNYRFTTQDETNNGEGMMRTHPRPEWIYRIEWENVAAESMTVSITDNTSDAYFSHGKQIGKSVTILTPIENTSLDIDLDFYTDVNNNSTIANRDNNVYEDLLLETSRFYLKATISSEDATKYKGQTVTLVNAFSDNGYQYANSNGAIHWDNSSIDANSSISSNSDATQLSFTVDANTTEYVIEWVFVTGSHYPGYGDIGFTYNISNYAISGVDGTFNNFTGDTSATIAFTNEPVGIAIWSGSKSLSWPANGAQAEYITINQNLPAGTQVTLHFTTSGGKLEVHDSNTQSFRPNGIASNRYTAGDNDDCFDVNNGETFVIFTLPNAVNGLKINGNAVTMTKIVAVYLNGAPTPTETVVFEYDFSASTSDITYNGGNGSTVKPTNGVLELYNPSPAAKNDYDVQIYVDKAYEAGNYTLTYRVKGDVNELVDGNDYNYTQLAFQKIDGYVNASDFRNISFTADWQPVSLTITVNQDCDRFLINFGKHVGYIYIDDLKLVKNN